MAHHRRWDCFLMDQSYFETRLSFHLKIFSLDLSFVCISLENFLNHLLGCLNVSLLSLQFQVFEFLKPGLFLTVEFLFIFSREGEGGGGVSRILRFLNPFKLYRYCSWTVLLKSLELKSSDPIEITNLANGNFYNWGRLRSLRLLSFPLNVPLSFISYTQLQTERAIVQRIIRDVCL